mmetsp:Transcript_15826/g.32721  ORF Transcript_15826/g.32721 Transcript_15826/m.32721 type:complete len:273 (-) Transcript_15826:801-1619(-)
MPFVRLVVDRRNHRNIVFGTGNVPETVRWRSIGVQLDCKFLAVLRWLSNFLFIDDEDFGVAILETDKDNLDVAIVVEVVDHIPFSRIQTVHLGGLSVLIGSTKVLASNGDHVAIFCGVLVDTTGAVEADIVVSLLGGLLESKNNESIVVPLVFRNPIEDEIVNASSVERVNGFGFVFVPSQLPTLLGVVTSAHVIGALGISHHACFVTVIALSNFSAVSKSKVVANFVHLSRNEATPVIVVKGILAVGVGKGHKSGGALRKAEHDEIKHGII